VSAAEQLAPTTGVAPACRALGVSKATVYRRRKGPAAVRPRRPSPRRLSDVERRDALDVLHSERFVDKAPGEVVATMLDEEQYICSERTMYRLLEAECEVRERRNQLRHPPYEKPELLATGPNQVWSWDITKLKGPAKWTYFYLFVILDIFSRYVVGWTLANRETAVVAKRLIQETCDKQGIVPGQVTIHADNGPAPAAKLVAQLLADLSITKSHSRPHVSNDNPYSEAQFKTLKYRPEFPPRFGCYEDAHAFCRTFFAWYNQEHRHSGIGMLTPEDLHYGRAEQIMAARQRTLDAAFQAHPERFVHGRPGPQKVPEAAWINPPTPTASSEEERH